MSSGSRGLPWPNIAIDDVLELDSGDVARVVDVVPTSAGSPIGALVKVEGEIVAELG